jgi:hypothetical protein
LYNKPKLYKPLGLDLSVEEHRLMGFLPHRRQLGEYSPTQEKL